VNSLKTDLRILADVLRIGRGGRTEILYGANMSHSQVGRYLEFLVKGGWVRRVPGPGSLYRVTPEGTALLERIDRLCAVLDWLDRTPAAS